MMRVKRSTSAPRVCLKCGQTYFRPERVTAWTWERRRYCGQECGRLGGWDGRRRSPSERFWAKVRKSENPNGCWVWTGAKDPLGYGRFRESTPALSKLITTHRFAWTITYGPIPEGLCVLHRCDNPPCVRPDHLWLGTLRDNARDMVNKGRNFVRENHGELNGMSRLTADRVRDIVKRSAAGEPRKDIAQRHSVTTQMICHIMRGHSWKHVTGFSATSRFLSVRRGLPFPISKPWRSPPCPESESLSKNQEASVVHRPQQPSA